MDDVLIRLRIGTEHAHYGGGLVDGAFLTKLFGDVATELLIRRDGDEGCSGFGSSGAAGRRMPSSPIV